MKEYVPDNYDAFCWHEAEQERREARLPRCSECDSPITEDFVYYINGEYICRSCMDNYLVATPVE